MTSKTTRPRKKRTIPAPPPRKVKGEIVKPKLGRSALLTDELINLFVEGIEGGLTDKDVYELLGVSAGAFYMWLSVGKAEAGLQEYPANVGMYGAEYRNRCKIFFEKVTRARAVARSMAVKAIRKAIEGMEYKEITETVFTETRLNAAGKPYEYRRVTKSETIRELAPDAKIALEYLARRDRQHWSNRTETVNIDFEVQIKQAIKAGEADYESLVEEFKDETLVRGWFIDAGVEPGAPLKEG